MFYNLFPFGETHDSPKYLSPLPKRSPKPLTLVDIEFRIGAFVDEYLV